MNLKALAVRTKQLIIMLIAKYPKLVPLGFLIAKGFAFEIQQYFIARYKFDQSTKSLENLFLYRRNIHRLEKGLLLYDGSRGFALDYIEQTLKLHRNLLDEDGSPFEILDWGKSVLSEYFKLPFAPVQLLSPQDQLTDALTYSNERVHKISDSFSEIALARRSVRHYRQQLISTDELERVMQLACTSPTACNRQPYRFAVVQGPLAGQVLGLAGGTSGWSENVRNVCVVIGDLSAYSSDTDRHLIYIDSSLATMQLINAMEMIGIVSCCVNWGHSRTQNEDLAKIVRLDKFEQPIMLVAFGYPTSKVKAPISAKVVNYEICRD